jgi:hypothetical protein
LEVKMTDTITLEEVAAMWPEYKWLCTACGETGSVAFDPTCPEPDVNFFPCECGAEDKKIKVDAVGKA